MEYILGWVLRARLWVASHPGIFVAFEEMYGDGCCISSSSKQGLCIRFETVDCIAGLLQSEEEEAAKDIRKFLRICAYVCEYVSDCQGNNRKSVQSSPIYPNNRCHSANARLGRHLCCPLPPTRSGAFSLVASQPARRSSSSCGSLCHSAREYLRTHFFFLLSSRLFSCTCLSTRNRVPWISEIDLDDPGCSLPKLAVSGQAVTQAFSTRRTEKPGQTLSRRRELDRKISYCWSHRPSRPMLVKPVKLGQCQQSGLPVMPDGASALLMAPLCLCLLSLPFHSLLPP